MDEKKPTAPITKSDNTTTQKPATKWGSANDFFKTDTDTPDHAWEKIRKDRERKKAQESDKTKS